MNRSAGPGAIFGRRYIRPRPGTTAAEAYTFANARLTTVRVVRTRNPPRRSASVDDRPFTALEAPACPTLGVDDADHCGPPRVKLSTTPSLFTSLHPSSYGGGVGVGLNRRQPPRRWLSSFGPWYAATVARNRRHDDQGREMTLDITPRASKVGLIHPNRDLGIHLLLVLLHHWPN